MRKTMKKQVLSALLSASILLGLIPSVPEAQALEVTAASFDPATQEMEIYFEVQHQQRFTIEVYANGIYFGDIITGEELSGSGAPLQPRAKTRSARVETDDSLATNTEDNDIEDNDIEDNDIENKDGLDSESNEIVEENTLILALNALDDTAGQDGVVDANAEAHDTCILQVKKGPEK